MTMTTTTVVLIRHRSGFANVADGFAVLEPGQHVDEYTSETETYRLPEGYHVARSNLGTLEIFDDAGRACDIVQHPSGRPQIIGDGAGYPVLAPAGAVA